eukprot:13495597-Ditylum_brightwellii.AAC.1
MLILNPNVNNVMRYVTMLPDKAHNACKVGHREEENIHRVTVGWLWRENFEFFLGVVVGGGVGRILVVG